MEHINRLLQRAMKVAEGRGKHVRGWVEYSQLLGAFTAAGSVLDAVEGCGADSFYSEHGTAAEAEASLNAFAARHPEAECTFFIDDLTFPEVIS